MFDELIDHEQRRWRDKLTSARKLLGSANKKYEEEPSAVRWADVLAARSLVEQTQARYEEWKRQ